MQEMTLKEIHDAELYVLKEVDAICRELGLKYWVMFGTLIGAVREHGFIPWDDDLDIVMKRDDYDKLVQYFMLTGKGGAKDLHLDHSLTIKTYTPYIARISEKKNHIEFNNQKYTSGIFIDVYPMDGLEGPQWHNSLRKNILKKLVRPKYSYRKVKAQKNHVSIYGRILASIRNYLSRIPLMIRMRYIVTDMLARKYKFDESDYVGIPGWELRFCWERKFFDETVYFKFEDFEVPAPIGYDEILRERYGDYMQLPPENERQPHHGYIAYKP